MDGKEILLMTDILLVGGAKETLAKREVIDGIENIGLPCPVEAHETIDVLRKQQVGRFAVLEIRQFEFVEIHIVLTTGRGTAGLRETSFTSVVLSRVSRLEVSCQLEFTQIHTQGQEIR